MTRASQVKTEEQALGMIHERYTVKYRPLIVSRAPGTLPTHEEFTAIAHLVDQHGWVFDIPSHREIVVNERITAVFPDLWKDRKPT